MHVIKLDGYNATVDNGEKLELGTFCSYGEEQLQIVKAPDWGNFSIIATFNPPYKKPVQAVVDSVTGVIKVPKEATADSYGVGTIVFVGLADGVQRISSDVEYIVRRHSNASGTEPAEPTPDLLQQVLTLSKDAQTAAKNAEQSAKNAAKDAADTVKPYKEEAVRAATAAALSEKNAAESKTAAQEAAERATQAGIAASNAAEEAERSAGIATDAAGGSALNAENAHKSALAAQQSANNAAESQSAAAASADAAAKSHQSAAIDAKTASDAKVAAAGSAEAAAGSANAAENSASAAAGSEQAAGTSELKAAKSEKAAKASEQAASESAQAALESKTAAATSEVNAAASAKKAQDVADSLPEDYTTAVNDIATLKQQVANITPDDSSIGYKPWSSKHIIDMLCQPLEESGNPVVCYPVAGYPLGIKAKWEPAQEGTGTPYPAGGGPNKLNVAGVVSSRTISGITFTINPDGTIGVNGTSTATCFLNPNTKFNKAYLQKIPAGTYRFDFEQTALSIFLFGYYEDGSEVPIVYAGNVVTYAQDAYVGPQIRVAAGATVNTTVRLMLHTGTSTPSAYAGWENIRPIKGRDSVTVERCGENLLNIKPFKKDTHKGITYEYVPDGGIHISGTATASVDSPTFPIWHLPPGKYYGLETGEGNPASLVVQRNGKNLYLNAKKEFTILAGDVTKYWYIITSTGVTVDKTVYPYIVPGTTAPTTYTPYIGQTNTLTLPETVYGGEVDAVSGEGQETWRLVTLDGTENFTEEAPKQYSIRLKEISYSGICSHFKNITITELQNHVFGVYLLYTGKAIFNTNFSSLDEFKHYLRAQFEAGTQIQICYKRKPDAPKQTFTATGAQAIPALAGLNTVLTDADSATVTGRADPIKRISDLEDAVASQT